MSTTLNRILYVEDDLDIQFVAQMALEEIGGYEVQVCSSGQEALDAAVPFQPDVILLDVMMPGMDGVTTLKELRNLPQMGETPIIFMTAKIQKHEIDHYHSLGAMDVIRKPFDPMTLPERIQEIWKLTGGV